MVVNLIVTLVVSMEPYTLNPEPCTIQELKLLGPLQ